MGGGDHYSGTAFKLTHDSWTERILYNFCSKPECGDGGSPQGNLVSDKRGGLCGIGGVAFELSRGPDGWKDTVLHDFTCGDGNGCEPYGLVMDPSGNLYGITTSGGTSKECGGGCGTAYELQPMADGRWKQRVLHQFGANNDNMAFPGGVLILDNTGGLYGIAAGGTYRSGVVYRLSRGAGGEWKAAIQHNFTGGAGGDNPSGGLVMDKSGNLYGVTVYGGDSNCSCGVVYKLSPSANGKLKYTVLHQFTGYDGAQPTAQLILDNQGNLYGTTATGGEGGAGVAFELTP